MNKKWMNSPFTYALGMFALMIPSQAFNSFYSYYYVEKLGLGVGLATLARTLYLIWDAVNQPIAGYLSDRTRTRFGRRKPWLYSAIPLFMAAFVMVFAVPHGLKDMDLFLWFLVSLILYEGVATILWVNYGALFPELFRGNRIRAKASAIQQGFQIVAILIGSALTPLVFDAFGFGYMALIYAVLFGLFMLLCVMSVQEGSQADAEPKLGLVEAFRETLKNKEFWLFNIANSFAQTVNGLLSSMIPFYAKYALRIPEAQVTFLLASIFVSVIPLVMVWYWIVNKLGAHNGWRVSLAVYALSVVPLWFGQGLASGITFGIIVGFGLAGFLVTPPVLNSRIIDLDTARTGQRREGVYTAVSGFITRSSGLISALSFWIIGMIYGYVSGDDPGPNPDLTFRVLICVVPFCLLMVSLIISLFLKPFSVNEDSRK
ncbi:MFS transporter [Paenibacillus nasutitermitis]|uniref:Sugar transporter n=1 Tax=Paenibacillus nasutitermitis TaxID=1652958 RepID=A0A916ZH24_9BACL|nr:MFS transporter [Paenibacillus nasutitermitis]GGD95351.1 sugar transporter [Paenibacillus nasutitermitis]